jgi:hypothetical protein
MSSRDHIIAARRTKALVSYVFATTTQDAALVNVNESIHRGQTQPTSECAPGSAKKSEGSLPQI